MDSNDIELFSTTDFKAKDKVVSILVRHRVSYLERWEKIPLLRRREYGGARELCVIYVNGNQYEKARKILDEFNEAYTGAKRAKRKKRREETEEKRAAAHASAPAREAAGGFDYDPGADNEIDEGIDDI